MMTDIFLDCAASFKITVLYMTLKDLCNLVPYIEFKVQMGNKLSCGVYLCKYLNFKQCLTQYTLSSNVKDVGKGKNVKLNS